VTPDYFGNAKYEDIVCKPLKPFYDGTPDNLVSFLNRLDIRRHDESWGIITYIKIHNQEYDLIRHFSQTFPLLLLIASQPLCVTMVLCSFGPSVTTSIGTMSPSLNLLSTKFDPQRLPHLLTIPVPISYISKTIYG